MATCISDGWPGCPQEFDELAAVNGARLMRMESGDYVARARRYLATLEPGERHWDHRCSGWVLDLLTDGLSERDLLPDLERYGPAAHNAAILAVMDETVSVQPRRTRVKREKPKPIKMGQLSLLDDIPEAE